MGFALACVRMDVQDKVRQMFNKLDADDDKTLCYSEFTDMMILDDMYRFNAVVHMYDQKPLPQVDVTEAAGPPELEVIDDVVVVEGCDMYVAISREKSTVQMFKRRSRTFVKHHDLGIKGGIKSVQSLAGTHSILILPHQFVEQVRKARPGPSTLALCGRRTRVGVIATTSVAASTSTHI